MSEHHFPRATAEHTRAWLGALTGFCIGIIVVLMIYSVTSARELVGEISKQQASNRNLFEAIAGCTDGVSPCAQRRQQEIDASTERVTMVTMIAVACADKPKSQTPEQISECVRQLLDQMRRAKGSP